jgi:FkbM family methyltransferase
MICRVPRIDGLRRVLSHPRVEPYVSTALLARLTEDPVRFALNERLRPGRIVAHRVRGARVDVVVEHGSPDVQVLDELFYQRIYEPPAEVDAALAALERPPRVLDVGANIGMFGAWALSRWPGATVDAFEPEPRNAALHRRAIARSGLAGEWRLHEAAAMAHDGTLAFAAGLYATGAPTAPGTPGAITVQALDVLPFLAQADLLKLDAEGSEWGILDDPRFPGEALRAVAIEYHPKQCPEPDARAAAVARLERAGFAVRDAPTAAPPGYGSLWAWRTGPASSST